MLLIIKTHYKHFSLIFEILTPLPPGAKCGGTTQIAASSDLAELREGGGGSEGVEIELKNQKPEI